jgi:hypothetical protein
MTTETKATEDRPEVRISKILVPVDGSEYSLNAAKYADIKDKVEYWFDKVRQLAKNAGLTDVKTEALVEANRF